MRSRAALVFALSIPLAVLAKEPPAPAPAPEAAVTEGVEVNGVSGTTTARATVIGKLAAVVALRGPGSAHDLLLLVAPADPKKPADDQAARPCDAPPGGENSPPAPRRLIRFDPSGKGSLATLRDDLPPDTRDLGASDLDGDGVDELLLVRASGVSMLRDDGSRRFAGAPASIVELAEGELGSILPGAIGTGTGRPSLLSIATLGALRTYGSEGAEGAIRLLTTVDLPLLAARAAGSGLDLSSPAAHRLALGSGVDVVVVDPEMRGADRIRTLLLHPGGTEEERRKEAWSKLPAPEKILESSFLALDGRPALAVTTVPAGKLSFFGEKLLRVFFLEGDRTRAGKPPVAALETNANLWQAVHVVAADVNGDGRQDLVVGYWKGLKDATVVLDAYLRREDGTFERSPRSTSFDVEKGDRAVLRYGEDLDGKGLPDLMLVGSGSLLLFPGGEPGSQGRRLVQSKPLWSVPLQGGVHEDRQMSITIGSEDTQIREIESPGLDPIVVDLDGDGRSEVVVPEVGGSPAHVLVVTPAR